MRTKHARLIRVGIKRAMRLDYVLGGWDGYARELMFSSYTPHHPLSRTAYERTYRRRPDVHV